MARRILVIEDDEDIAGLIKLQFSALEYDVTSCSDGCSGLIEASSNVYDGDVSFFVCKALVDFSTALLAAPCAGQERAARW